MATLDTRNALNFPVYPGGMAYAAVPGKAGANQASASPYMFPITNREDLPVYELPEGETILTLAMIRNYSLIRAINDNATALKVPTEAILAWTRAAGKDLWFRAQRAGNGTFSINYDTVAGVTLVAGAEFDPSLIPKWRVVTCMTVGHLGANKWIQT